MEFVLLLLLIQATVGIKILILVFEKISALHIPTKCINTWKLS